MTASALAYGCIASEPAPATKAPVSSSAALSAAPSASTSASASASALAPAPPVEVGFDPNTVVLIIDDPRLSDVKAAAQQEAFVRAVELLQAKLSAITPLAPPLTPEDRAAWLYQLGKLRVSAGDPLGAAKAFEECSTTEGPLVDYARYQAADLLQRAGKHEKALEISAKIAPNLGIADELELVTAAAKAGTHDIDSASKIWRSYLARSPRPSNWVNVTLKFATALMEHPSEARNEEAVKLARTIIDGSGSAGVGEAKEIETKALGLLPSKKRAAFQKATSDDLLSRAKRLSAVGQLKEALKVSDSISKGGLVPKKPDKLCESKLVRGEILGKMKRKAESADAYEEAVIACKDLPRHVDALFNAGKWLSTTGRYNEGTKRFEELEKSYATHRLADDARFKRALAAKANADEATFIKLLTSLPDDYPKGDLVSDALFELGVHNAEKRAWMAAIKPLQRAAELEKEKRERLYYQAGRFGYFLGRAYLETGGEEKGKEALADVIRTYPLSYYMTLAYARLAERDATFAKQTLTGAIAREAAEPFYVPPHPSLKTPTFVRAVELVRQGEHRLARGELDLLGVGDRTAPKEVLWAAALLFARAGAATQSHGVLRSASTTSVSSRVELTEWLEHYPAGKWRAAWELAFPRPYPELVATAANDSGIPEALAYAIMREESAFDPRVVSSAQAVGLMQLIVPTAKRMAKPLHLPHDVESLKKPHVNIPLGCRYLGQLRKQFPDNVLLSIPGYNAGGGAPKKWLEERAGYDFDVWVERIPYDETQKYTKRVIGSMAAYELLYWADKPTEARATPRAAGPAPSSVASLPAASAPAPADPPAEESQ
ncbi:MAG: transglycosylase SLT domain-containing protein [Polyangiaceae bacterium]|nr:transglycosylase SLT domain-containing protein [Polyangiaceae bacterium]